PPKPPRMRNVSQSSATLQESETVYAEAPPKPPRMRNVSQSSATLQENETVYAEAPPKPPRMRNVSQSSATLQESETARKTRALSGEEIASIVPHNQLVKLYQAQIQQWSKIVFGKEDVLQERTEQILTKPAMGDELASQLAEHPQSFHKYAGSNICGLKNNARKKAEAGLVSLRKMVDCYTEAVKHARESLLQNPDAELKRYAQSMSGAVIVKILQKSPQPEKKGEPLLNEEITSKVKEHRTVQRYQAQIQQWSKIVFGKEDVLQERTEQILTKPAMGDELASQLAEHPQSFHKYAGSNICGLKNNARKKAEAGLSHLIDTIGNYANTVQRVKESLLQTQSVSQEQSVSPASQLQDLSQSSELSQKLSAIKNPETTEASTHISEKAQNVQLRKATLPKAMALAS
ncbi:BID domain-containing T4SS effector, partial [Bartonella heixiaziensis]|uniref:BID domain-containing T4SS effector n=1 Tax=Bartonella heixiaziensis TaxID=1461000 RepID=UPI003D1EF90F